MPEFEVEPVDGALGQLPLCLVIGGLAAARMERVPRIPATPRIRGRKLSPVVLTANAAGVQQPEVVGYTQKHTEQSPEDIVDELVVRSPQGAARALAAEPLKLTNRLLCRSQAIDEILSIAA